MTERAPYIWIDGTDGIGKTTQVELTAKRLKDEYGFDSVIFNEPDGVPVAAELREIIKNAELEKDRVTVALLVTAARRENWRQQGQKALRDGKAVLNARTPFSTEVYQGEGQGLDIKIIKHLTSSYTELDYNAPDVKLFLDLEDEAERLRRIVGRGALTKPDTFESMDDDFQNRIKNGFRKIAIRESIPLISTIGTRDEVNDRIWEYVVPVVES